MGCTSREVQVKILVQPLTSYITLGKSRSLIDLQIPPLKLDCSEIKHVKSLLCSRSLLHTSFLPHPPFLQSFDITPKLPDFSKITYIVSDISVGFRQWHWRQHFFFFCLKPLLAHMTHSTVSSFKMFASNFLVGDPILFQEIIFTSLSLSSIMTC